jgi:hypothetical protein
MASREEKQAKEGVVRCTSNRVWNLYDQVKRYSPVLRYGFETVEHRIPERIVKMSDPLIEGLDHKIDDLKERAHKVQESATSSALDLKERVHKVQESATSSALDLKERAYKVQESATTSAREKANKLKQTTNNVLLPVQEAFQALDADHDGKVSFGDVKTSVSAKTSEVMSKTSEKISDMKTSVSTRTSEAVTMTTGKLGEMKAAVTTRTCDAVTKTTEKLSDMKTSVTTKTSEAVTKTTEKWKDLRGEMSKKATERLETGFGKVCEFSATRGKEMIHIDLIQYSREVIDGASAAVSHRFGDLSASVAAAVLKASEAKTHLQEAVVHMSTQTREQLAGARANLRLRLKAAIQAARELSASSVSFVHTKYGQASENVSHLPENIVARLPEPAKRSVDFILSSPELFVRIKNKADIDASKRTLENINNLMSAVKDVVFEGKEGPEDHLDS